LVTASVGQSQLWPANHKLVNVGLVVTVTPPTARLAVLVYANDKASAADAGDIGPGTLQLRAEHQDKGGRVYLLVARASTSAGTGFDVCTVVVPRNQSNAAVEAVQQESAAAEAAYRQTRTAPQGFV